MILQVQGLKKTYGKGSASVQALRGLSFEVKQGSFTVVMGKSGCGKSTLLHILSGILDPSEGHILINNEDMYEMSDRHRTLFRKREIGFVFQFFNIFPELTIKENIMLPLRINKIDIDEEHYNTLIKELELETMLDRYPSTLSGGQQQRVAIARALIHKPSIVFADEPTGNLDEETSKVVMDIFKKLQKSLNQSIILVTHDADLVKYADRVIEMRDGLITLDV